MVAKGRVKMTDRVSTLTVVLERDMRDDDVQIVAEAIKMIRFVASVESNVVDVAEYTARQRVRFEIERKLVKTVVAICRNEPAD